MFRNRKKLIDKNGVLTTRFVNSSADATTERVATMKAEPPQVTEPSSHVVTKIAHSVAASSSRSGTEWHVRSDDGKVEKCSSPYNCPFGGYDNGHTKTMKAATALRDDYRNAIHDVDGAAYFFFMSDDAAETFTQGGCAVLAKDISRSTGYPLVAVGIRESSGEVDWVHAAVKSSDGRFLDVTGIQSKAHLTAAWSEHMSVRGDQSLVIEIVDDRMLDSYFAGDGATQEYDPELVAVTAVQVVDALAMDFEKR